MFLGGDEFSEHVEELSLVWRNIVLWDAVGRVGLEDRLEEQIQVQDTVIDEFVVCDHPSAGLGGVVCGHFLGALRMHWRRVGWLDEVLAALCWSAACWVGEGWMRRSR